MIEQLLKIKRLIACNPADVNAIRTMIKADDIKIIVTAYCQPGHYVVSSDVKKETVIIRHGYDADDLMNNKYSIVLGQVFK